jgi:4a-hydroxytetrahydrobiopterin dehydratase
VALADRKCGPCKGGTPPLPREEAEKLRAAEVPRWELSERADRLRREFSFKDFRKAMKFVHAMAELAEAEGHHPDFHVHYNKVLVEIWTHKIGGLHENDFILAAKIDRLVQ